MRHKFAPAALILSVFLFSGCVRNYFEIRGSVVDAATKQPIAGAAVTLVAATRAYSNVSDSKGEFSIRYSVSRNQFKNMAAWLLAIEAEDYAVQIIPMFQPVKLFGYYRRREVKLRMVKPPDNSKTEPSGPDKKNRDPLADHEAIRRVHLLSRYVFLDTLVRRTKSSGEKDPVPTFINHKRDGFVKVAMTEKERRNFAAALAAHMVADESSVMRREAARVAWRWKSPGIIHALIIALEDENKNVRYFASRSLERVSGAAGNIIYRDNDENTRRKKVKAWREWRKRVFP